MVESVVVHTEEQDDLSEKGDTEPDVPNCMRSTNIRDLFQGLSIGEEVEVDGGQKAQHHRLLLRVFEVSKVHFGKRVSLDHRRNGQNFIGLNGSYQCSDGLPNDNEHTFDGVGMFGCERSSNACISELDFIISQQSAGFHCLLLHAFLSKLR